VDVSFTSSLDRVEPVDWRRLAERAGHVFATREWLLTWWRHYGKGHRQLIGIARDGGDPVAIVPLYEWWRRGVPILRFIGHGPSDQLGPICAPLSEPASARGVGLALRDVPLRRFVLLAEDVAGDQHFGDLTGARSLYRDASPVLRFECDSWDDFLRERGRNFRQQTRRFPRKLSELGKVSYRLADDPDRLGRDLDTLFHLHRQRWDGAATEFLLAEPFHREFAAQAFRRGWLRLWFLEIDGKPVAALYGFRFGGAESAYQAGREPALAQQPVGFVLLAHAVREALTDGMGEYRLLRGGAAYKERFATNDPGLETFGLPRGASAQLMLGAACAARGRSLGLRRILDRTGQQRVGAAPQAVT
jgi:CelD/BcsL family acetyltransferase involved in cellulose biosynthesis